MMIAKKTQLLTLAAAFLIPIGAQANDIDPIFEFMGAVPAANSIEIDGDLGEWMSFNALENPKFSIPKGSGDAGQLVIFEEYGGGTWNGPDDHSSAIQVVYDADNVYVGIVVTDDYHENTANSPWNGDSVQFMIANADRDTQIGLYNYALGGVEGALGDVITNHQAGPGGTEAFITRNSETRRTTYEICLPKESLGLDELIPGVQFGLGMAINDGDEDTPGQRGWGGLGPHSIVFGKTPNETAQITLVKDEPGSRDSSNYFQAVSEDGPNGYWTLDEAAGVRGTLAPNLGNLGAAANGRLFGDTFEANGPNLPGFGRNNTAMGVDGLFPGGLRVAEPILDGRQEFTITAWVQPGEQLGDRIGLFGQDDVIEIGFINPDLLQSWNEVDSTTDGVFKFADVSAVPVLDGQWHHLAFSTDDDGVMRFYIDAEKQPIVGGANSDVSLEDLGANTLGISNNPFYVAGGTIFGYPFDTQFDGAIDEVAVFDRALTEAEIQTLFSAAFTTGSLDGDAGFILNLVEQADLSPGTTTSLTAKLKAHNNPGSQINALEALVHQMNALSGKKIATEDAGQIIEASLRTIKLYGRSHAVPEPSGLILLALGLLSVAMFRTNRIGVTR